MNLKEIMKFRHTIKQYDAKKELSEETWQQIIEFGSSAPSSMGFEPFRMVVVDRNSETAKKITSDYMFDNAHHVQEGNKTIFYIYQNEKAWEKGEFFESRVRNNMHLGDLRKGVNKNPEDYSDEEAKASVENTMRFVGYMGFDQMSQMADWARRQAYIALGFMAIAAAELKVDTTSIEGFLPGKLTDLFRELGLITDEENVGLIQVFGYRESDKAFNPTNRVPMKTKFQEAK